MKFIIISAVYNMSAQLKANIEMLKQQEYHNFEVYFGDDMSTDNSCEIILENIKEDDRFHLIRHQQKLFSMGNIYRTIEIANPNDEDIIVLVDGDDSLASEQSLAYLATTYQTEDCLMTYGSYSVKGKKDRVCRPYSKWITHFGLFRYVKWRASHLKTFKFTLWKNIDKKDLTITRQEYSKLIYNTLLKGKFKTWWNFKKVKYEDIVTSNEEFVRRCDDKVFTLPMLEMAGNKSYFIEKVLYHYNPHGAHDFGNSNIKWAQRFIRNAAFSKPGYKRSH